MRRRGHRSNMLRRHVPHEHRAEHVPELRLGVRARHAPHFGREHTKRVHVRRGRVGAFKERLGCHVGRRADQRRGGTGAPTTAASLAARTAAAAAARRVRGDCRRGCGGGGGGGDTPPPLPGGVPLHERVVALPFWPITSRNEAMYIEYTKAIAELDMWESSVVRARATGAAPPIADAVRKPPAPPGPPNGAVFATNNTVIDKNAASASAALTPPDIRSSSASSTLPCALRSAASASLREKPIWLSDAMSASLSGGPPPLPAPRLV
mmetsp:Transcript_50239/g.123501  ORF Transcript_50239/g.123501 Transcript_50239/m.123501 type:complete len:266 (+) Transcript_50239:238-1035(+)